MKVRVRPGAPIFHLIKYILSMIKLRDLLEADYTSVGLFSESPMRIRRWNVSELEPLGGNRMFTVGVKEKAKKVGRFDKYDIYEYLTNDGYTIDCFIFDEDTLAFFQYKITDGRCSIFRVWQDPISTGLNRKIILNYYLNKYKSILTDDAHTELGEKSVKRLFKQSLDLGYKIFVLKDNDEKLYITDLKDLEPYYSVGIRGLTYRFGIDK